MQMWILSSKVEWSNFFMVHEKLSYRVQLVLNCSHKQAHLKSIHGALNLLKYPLGVLKYQLQLCLTCAVQGSTEYISALVHCYTHVHSYRYILYVMWRAISSSLYVCPWYNHRTSHAQCVHAFIQIKAHTHTYNTHTYRAWNNSRPSAIFQPISGI